MQNIHAMETFSKTARCCLEAGTNANLLIAKIAQLASFKNCPRVVAFCLKFIGRSTSMQGIVFTQCEALELVYVDQRWHAGKSFFSYCLTNEWQHRFELFLRSLGQPTILSRHGATRDKALLEHAFQRAGISAQPVLAACASFAKNKAFPADIAETPSFLNVLGVTPIMLKNAAEKLHP